MSAYAKAIAAAIIGFATAFISALLPYVEGGLGDITLFGWLTALLAGLVSLAAAGGIVYATPNTPQE